MLLEVSSWQHPFGERSIWQDSKHSRCSSGKGQVRKHQRALAPRDPRLLPVRLGVTALGLNPHREPPRTARGNEELCFSPSQEKVPRGTPPHLTGKTQFASAAGTLPTSEPRFISCQLLLLEASGSATLGAGQKTPLPWHGAQCCLCAAKTTLPAINLLPVRKIVLVGRDR